jgi:hypothetical protein
MSYDIFLACVRGNETIRFKREVFEEVFLPHCPYLKSYRDDPEFMQVEYEDGSRADIYIHNNSSQEEARQRARGAPEKILALPEFPPGDPAYIENLAFDHFGGDTFFRDLYAIADRTDSMIFAGGLKPTVVVTKEAVLKKMPSDFLGMKNARVVHNPGELEAAIFSA